MLCMVNLHFWIFKAKAHPRETPPQAKVEKDLHEAKGASQLPPLDTLINFDTMTSPYMINFDKLWCLLIFDLIWCPPAPGPRPAPSLAKRFKAVKMWPSSLSASSNPRCAWMVLGCEDPNCWLMSSNLGMVIVCHATAAKRKTWWKLCSRYGTQRMQQCSSRTNKHDLNTEELLPPKQKLLCQGTILQIPHTHLFDFPDAIWFLPRASCSAWYQDACRRVAAENLVDCFWRRWGWNSLHPPRKQTWGFNNLPFTKRSGKIISVGRTVSYQILNFDLGLQLQSRCHLNISLNL